jgi:hypothetical protein
MKGNITALLKPEYIEQNFSVTEDEDFVYLHKDGKVIEVFSSHGATIEKIELEINKREGLSEEVSN